MGAKVRTEMRNGYPMVVARCEGCKWSIGYSAVYDEDYARARAKADCKKHNKENHA